MRPLERWDPANPRKTLTDVLDRVRPQPDDVLVAMLRASRGGARELLDVTRVHHGPNPDSFDASDLLRDHAQSKAGDRPWTGKGWAPPEHLFVTVVCRSGRVVPTVQDYFWLGAWRYSNHLTNALDGDVFLVTEHGWTGCIDHRAGFEPSLRDSSRRLALAPPL